jgi:hypothetical protein
MYTPRSIKYSTHSSINRYPSCRNRPVSSLQPFALLTPALPFPSPSSLPLPSIVLIFRLWRVRTLYFPLSTPVPAYLRTCVPAYLLRASGVEWGTGVQTKRLVHPARAWCQSPHVGKREKAEKKSMTLPEVLVVDRRGTPTTATRRDHRSVVQLE